MITGAEVNDRCLTTFRLFGVREGMNARSRWPMASDVARYLGEPVVRRSRHQPFSRLGRS